MKILILDDLKVRHDTFEKMYTGHEVVSVYRFSEFAAQIKDQKWDLIHLDHDLGEAENADYRIDGWGSRRDYTGYDASWRLVLTCEMNPELMPDRVIVHSVNPTGAKRMLDELMHAGFNVTWDPFGDLE